MDNVVVPAVVKKAVEAEGLAKLYCPVDLGYLRGSITHNIEKEGNTIKAYIGTPVSYAGYIEYGTGIYAQGGDGRKTPWTYFDEKNQEFITTIGQVPKLFMWKAYQKIKESKL